MKPAIADWHQMAVLGGAVILAGGIAAVWRVGRASKPSDKERERRAYLNRVGRIVDGQVLEIMEKADEDTVGKRRSRKPQTVVAQATPLQHLLIYTYSISGVTYEAAQNISGLEEKACLDSVVAGQPVGVKYDPANPSNSILIADDWSGLR